MYKRQRHNRLVELNFEKGLDPDGNEIRVQGRLICRKVFGISVDKETFDQYQQKRYQVCDKNLPMNIVEIYANSKEIETELPEMSKEMCIRDRIFIVSDDAKIRDTFESNKEVYVNLAGASEIAVQADKTGIEEDAVSVVIPGATLYLPLED